MHLKLGCPCRVSKLQKMGGRFVANMVAAMLLCLASVSAQECLNFDSNMGATYDLKDLQRYVCPLRFSVTLLPGIVFIKCSQKKSLW